MGRTSKEISMSWLHLRVKAALLRADDSEKLRFLGPWLLPIQRCLLEPDGL
jgi:hypothetical protein